MSDINGWSSGPYGISSWGGSAYARDVAEDGTASDLLSALVVLTSDINEEASILASVPFASRGFGASVLEIADVSDQVSALVDIQCSVLEAALMQFEVLTSYEVNGLIQEISQGSNIVSSIVQIGNVVSESATMADVLFGSLSLDSVVVEATTGSDEISAIVILIPASIVESCNIADLISTIATLNIPVLEGATASEQNVALVIFNSSILESANIADTISCRLLWEIIDTSESTTWNVIPTSN